MRNTIKTALAVVSFSMFVAPVMAEDLGLVSPETLGASVLGSTEMIVHVPTQQDSKALTVAPIDVTNIEQVNAFPGTGQKLDMSGTDGSLRSCYANGGIAKQNQTLDYVCATDDRGSATQVQQTQTQSEYITPPDQDTGYDGTTNVEDPALLDCVSRGGSLIQLSANGQFACAM